MMKINMQQTRPVQQYIEHLLLLQTSCNFCRFPLTFVDLFTNFSLFSHQPAAVSKQTVHQECQVFEQKLDQLEEGLKANNTPPGAVRKVTCCD